jgi:hypothetical protein
VAKKCAYSIWWNIGFWLSPASFESISTTQASNLTRTKLRDTTAHPTTNTFDDDTKHIIHATVPQIRYIPTQNLNPPQFTHTHHIIFRYPTFEANTYDIRHTLSHSPAYTPHRKLRILTARVHCGGTMAKRGVLFPRIPSRTPFILLHLDPIHR